MKKNGKRTLRRYGNSIGLVVAVALVGAATAAATQDTPETPHASTSVAEHYLAIQTALAGDSLDTVSRHATAIRELTTPTDAAADDSRANTPAEPSPAVSDAAASLAGAESLEKARAAFATLSDALILDKDMIAAAHLRVAYCPMAQKSWLQDGDTIANPYFGSAMLRCGKFVDPAPHDAAHH